MKLNFHATSVAGRRAENEDSYLSLHLGDNLYVFAVADGMGGSIAGKKASSMVVDYLNSYFEETAQKLTAQNLKTHLGFVFDECQGIIREAIKNDASLQGMGTTLTIMLVLGNEYAYGNLGDSRIYRLRNKVLTQLTTDHTYIEDLKQNGTEITPELTKKYGNYLVKAVDGGEDKPDIFPTQKECLRLDKDSIWMICSDGLILDKGVDEQQGFINTIVGQKELQHAAENLVSHAINSGSTDNVSVLLVENGRHKRDNKNKAPISFSKILVLLVLLPISLICFIYVYDKIDASHSDAGNSIFPDSLSILGVDLISAEENTFLDNNGSELQQEDPQNIDVSKWKPLKKFSLPLEFSEDIHWTSFPYQDSVAQYSIVFSNDNERLEILVPGNQTYVSLQELKDLEGKIFTIQVNALLSNKTSISGNHEIFNIK